MSDTKCSWCINRVPIERANTVQSTGKPFPMCEACAEYFMNRKKPGNWPLALIMTVIVIAVAVWVRFLKQ